MYVENMRFNYSLQLESNIFKLTDEFLLHNIDLQSRNYVYVVAMKGRWY
jgi:hypothetical protein